MFLNPWSTTKPANHDGGLPDGNPLLSSAKDWDDERDAWRANAEGWRNAALTLGVGCVLLLGGITWLAAQSRTKVVVLDEAAIMRPLIQPLEDFVRGNVPAHEAAADLIGWIKDIRGFIDPVHRTKAWENAQYFTVGGAATKLKTWMDAQDDPPVGTVIEVQPGPAVEEAQGVWSMRWTETTWHNGQERERRNYSATVHVERGSPRSTIDGIRANPRALDIVNFGWSEDVRGVQ